MATLWQRSRSARAAGDIVTIDDYIGAVAEWGPYGRTPLGVTMTQNGQGTEPVPVDFAGMSAQMFGSNSVIFACMLARLSVFSQVRFQYQRIRNGRPGALFGDPTLSILEHPWVGGVTSDLLARMITDADLAGNAYIAVNQGEVVRLRPDWVDIVLVPREVALPGLDGLDAGVGTIGWKRLGYLYYEDGIRDDRGVPFLANQVCHFAPIPDPTATYRGMSWLTPVVRDVSADRAMTVHKDAFIRNSATPNMVIKHQPNVTPNMMRAFRDVMDVEYCRGRQRRQDDAHRRRSRPDRRRSGLRADRPAAGAGRRGNPHRRRRRRPPDHRRTVRRIAGSDLFELRPSSPAIRRRNAAPAVDKRRRIAGSDQAGPWSRRPSVV
jgi:hypothetical protein